MGVGSVGSVDVVEGVDDVVGVVGVEGVGGVGSVGGVEHGECVRIVDSYMGVGGIDGIEGFEGDEGVVEMKSSAPKGIDWDAQPLGKMPDTKLAKILGVSHEAVARARWRRQIGCYRARTVRSRPQLAREIMDALPLHRNDVIPIRHLALMLLVGDELLCFEEVRDGLGIAQSTASSLIASAEKVGRIATARASDGKRGAPRTYVRLGPRGFREMSRRRG